MTLSAHMWRWWRTSRNTARQFIIKEPARALAVFLVIMSLWLLIGGLIGSLLVYLSQPEYVAIKPRLMETLLALFCFILFFLVVMSDTAVVWSGIFRTRAAIFQAQLPGTDRTLFWAAALEGGMWASWAVGVLMVPLILILSGDALITMMQDRLFITDPLIKIVSGKWGVFVPHTSAIVSECVATSAGMTLILLSFVVCCLAVGSLLALIFARIIPIVRRSFKPLLIVGLLALLIGAAMTMGDNHASTNKANFLQQVIGRMAFAENPLLPSWWTQQGMTAALNGRWNDCGYYFVLLISTTAGVMVIAEWYAARRLRKDADALTGRPSADSRRGRSRPWRLLPLFPADIALLVTKDLRLFARDPAQIIQFTMFFGLLAFYLLMLPRIGSEYLLDEQWRPFVSLLSLLAVAMALATFTGRFVFPLLSLEGNRLWILALAPWPRERIVTAKFAFALVVGLPVSVGLVLMSGYLLGLSGTLILYEVFIMLCLASGFAAGALGLGARLADYGEDNSAKLVAGYGGTVNLLVTLLYAAIVVAGASLPVINSAAGPWLWVIGSLWTLIIATVWTWTFMTMAWRWFGRSDQRTSTSV